MCREGKRFLYLEPNGRTEQIKSINDKIVYLRAVIDYPDNEHRLYYSTDGKRYVEAGKP